MYHANDLNIYPFFREDLEGYPIGAVLDSLTGVVSRAFILQFMQDLIERKIPFTVGLVDMDNFKSFNDNYGHSTGDRVLQIVAESLIEFIGNRGLVGRFGGDEFLLIYLGGNDYDHVHEMYEEMYAGKIFRRDINVDHLKLFVTATIGSASYPDNADHYEALFALIDKTLYRGKFKGRNCFIMYVKAKHEHLEIPKLAKRSLYDTLDRMTEAFQAGSSTFDRLRRAFVPMQEYLHLHELFYIDNRRRMTNVMTGELMGEMDDIAALSPARMHPLHDLEELKSACPRLYGFLTGIGQQASLIHRIVTPDGGPGYLLLCPEPQTLHIWQDEECATALILAKMMSLNLALNNCKNT